MKHLLIILLCSNFLISQNEIEVEYYFENQCGSLTSKDSISFELQNLKTNESYFSDNLKVKIPSPGKYELFVTINDKNIERSFEEIIEFKNVLRVNDTIAIPRILYVSEKLNDNFEYDNEIEPKYYNCQNICENYELDYFKNGKTRFEGEFKNGKPIWNSEYQRDGSYIKYHYDKLDRWYKWEYYDQNGNLTKYLKNIYRKKYWIQKTFNSKGKLMSKEIKVNYPINN
jgi:antitoxin component YwqK of YwqJK toxin-antitoxin module